MRVLVTGAAGFIGRELCRRLVSSGHAVLAATRGPVELDDGVENVVVGDIEAVQRWPALDGCDAVVHLAAHVHRMKITADDRRLFREVNIDATRRLVEEARARGVRRFVFLSTVKVHGDASGARPFVEASPAAPEDDYARSKLEAEVFVRRSGVPNVILRPPLVYGPGVGANFLELLRAVASRWPLPLGSVKNRRSLVFVGNLAHAIETCLEADVESDATYMVSDGEAISSAELVRRMASSLGVSARLLPVPVTALRLGGALIGRGDAVGRLVGSLHVDDSAIRRELMWVPPFTLDDGLRITVEWFRSRVAA